jgi:hypothetical protein
MPCDNQNVYDIGWEQIIGNSDSQLQTEDQQLHLNGIHVYCLLSWYVSKKSFPTSPRLFHLVDK